MKRILALFLSIALLLTGCSTTPVPKVAEESTVVDPTESTFPADVVVMDPVESIELSYTGLNDEALLRQVEDLVYMETINSLNGGDYVVEGVQAIFISKEYIDELMFNSQSNVFFGYTLEELNSLFQGTKYVFTLDEAGNTTVVEQEEFEARTMETVLKNVAIGTGVILICVTVSSVTVTAAPAVSMIFAASAKTGAVMALSSAGFGGITAGIVRFVDTGDLEEAAKTAALTASDSFKWGAISGAVSGGGKEAFALWKATGGGLTMNEVAIIQRESNFPMDVIEQLHSMKEYEIYRWANLRTFMIDGKLALIQNIDLNYVSVLPDGTKITNLARMQRGMAPLDPLTNKAYELHHIGQNPNSTLAILTQEQHRGEGVFAVLHDIWQDSPVDHGPEWEQVRKSFWKYLGNLYAAGGI